MKKIQKKKGVTLVALAITIIIMLLLAGVVMQMALGDNGLIAKVSQSKIEQARAELYETAKIEYLSLKTKAIAKDEEEPPVSEVLSASGFLAKYDVNGDNITDKKGEVIDTKDNLLAKLSGMVSLGSGGHTTPSTPSAPETPSPQPYPEQSYPKTIDGVTIYEHDKDKMILKIKIKEQTKLAIRQNTYIPDPYNVEVEWGNWGYDVFRPDYSGSANGEHEYYPGEYTMKITGAKSFSLESGEWRDDKYEITVLHWGKFESDPNEQNNIRLNSVKDIKMPEPNDVTVEYNQALLSNVPEDLFKYKPTRKKISFFQNSQNITSIPEDLYKYNTGMIDASYVFHGCNNITSIPEGLFKYNKNLISISMMFSNNKITNIPENLFKYNTELRSISYLFAATKVSNIPENLFKYNTKLQTISLLFSGSNEIKTVPEDLLKYNTEVLNFNSVLSNLRNLESIPENLFKYNIKAINFQNAFTGNEKLKIIPENLFKNNIEANDFSGTFQGCQELESIPENLFSNNSKVINFIYTFYGLKKLKAIPENLFKNNIEAENFGGVFQGCIEIENIPENLFDKNLEAKDFNSSFLGCIKLNNIPWNLFQNNNKSNNFVTTFSDCISLTYVNLPNRCYSLQESQYRGIFRGCNNAYNYDSIPESWKSW